MKCSASQTTSSVNKTPAAAADSSRHAAEETKLREVATQFEAVLVSVAMRPVAKGMGPMGDLIVQQMSTQLASGMSEPLYEQLKAQLG